MSELANDMTKLVNKLERQLGLIPLTPHLPEQFGKDVWADVINTDSIVTFSRYYPYKIPYIVSDGTTKKDKDGYYIIDGDSIGGAIVTHIMDLDWSDFSNNSLSLSQTMGYGVPDLGMLSYGYEDILNFQMRADQASLYNNGIYLDIKQPNKVKLVGAGNYQLNLIHDFKIHIGIQHPGLYTISPTVMNTFEQLAKADVASFLYNNLKYYEMDTVYASIDMHLTDLQTEAAKHDDIVQLLEQNYVSAGNDSVPIMMTI